LLASGARAVAEEEWPLFMICQASCSRSTRSIVMA
jgi:hypothetical protein